MWFSSPTSRGPRSPGRSGSSEALRVNRRFESLSRVGPERRSLAGESSRERPGGKKVFRDEGSLTPLGAILAAVYATRRGRGTDLVRLVTAFHTAAALGAAAFLLSACSDNAQRSALDLPSAARGQAQPRSQSTPSQADCLTSSCMYVYDQDQGAILIYPWNTNGNVKPTKQMTGPYIASSSCGILDGNCSNNIAVDSSHNIYVSSTSVSPPTAAIAIFKAGKYGSVTPERIISGANTGLSFPPSVAVDSTGKIYAVNVYYGNTCQAEQGNVSIYRAHSNGNVAPIAVIQVHYVRAVAVDGDGDVYTIGSDSSPSSCLASVHVYASVRHTYELVQDISGADTQLSNATGIAVDSMKNIYISTNFNNSLLKFQAGSTGDAAPSADISGSKTGLSQPMGIAVDGSGNIYSANLTLPGINAYPPGSNGNATPSQIITGAKTKLKAPNTILVK